jgi:hypothetical protein
MSLIAGFDFMKARHRVRGARLRLPASGAGLPSWPNAHSCPSRSRRIESHRRPNEKAAWDHLKQRKAECIEAIAEYERDLENDPSCETADVLRQEIQYEQELLDKIRTVVKD